MVIVLVMHQILKLKMKIHEYVINNILNIYMYILLLLFYLYIIVVKYSIQGYNINFLLIIIRIHIYNDIYIYNKRRSYHKYS